MSICSSPNSLQPTQKATSQTKKSRNCFTIQCQSDGEQTSLIRVRTYNRFQSKSFAPIWCNKRRKQTLIVRRFATQIKRIKRSLLTRIRVVNTRNIITLLTRTLTRIIRKIVNSQMMMPAPSMVDPTPGGCAIKINMAKISAQEDPVISPAPIQLNLDLIDNPFTKVHLTKFKFSQTKAA